MSENKRDDKRGDYKRYQCPGCGYVYDERLGAPREGFAPGTRWSAVPESWACEDCAVRDKVDFIEIEETTA